MSYYGQIYWKKLFPLNFISTLQSLSSTSTKSTPWLPGCTYHPHYQRLLVLLHLQRTYHNRPCDSVSPSWSDTTQISYLEVFISSPPIPIFKRASQNRVEAIYSTPSPNNYSLIVCGEKWMWIVLLLQFLHCFSPCFHFRRHKIKFTVKISNAFTIILLQPFLSNETEFRSINNSPWLQ